MLDTGGGPVKSAILSAVIETARQRVLAVIDPADLVDLASALHPYPSFKTERRRSQR